MDVVPLGHGVNLVVGKFGQFSGDQGRSSLGDVGMGEEYVQFLERPAGGLGVEEPDEGQKDHIGDGEDQEGVGADRGRHGRQDLHH